MHLGGGRHINRNCQEEGCRRCGGRHHTWIHYENVKREKLRSCQGLTANSRQAPPVPNNRWTEIHQVFLVPPPGRAAPPNNPRQGTSQGETLLQTESMYESLSPAETIQSWRLNSSNRRQIKSQQPNAQEWHLVAGGSVGFPARSGNRNKISNFFLKNYLWFLRKYGKIGKF